jgi:hypothetical protein
MFSPIKFKTQKVKLNKELSSQSSSSIVMSVLHLLDLKTDLLHNCLQFLSLDELRSLDKTALFSTKHNQLLKAMEDVLINNDLEKPIDLQDMCALLASISGVVIILHGTRN